jgi:hypothetical protein
MLQRVLLCMSRSAHTRSVAQAMECQFLPCPRVPLEMPVVKAGLGASAVVVIIAGVARPCLVLNSSQEPGGGEIR